MLRSQTLIDTARRLLVPLLPLRGRALLMLAVSAGAATVGAAQPVSERSAAGVASCAALSADARESAAPLGDTTAAHTNDVAASGAAPVDCEREDDRNGAGGRFVPRRIRTGAFAAVLTVGVGSNAVFGLDRTRRGQPDVFIAGNAAAHVALMASLTQAGIAAGVAPWKSAALVTAAGVGFELSQGLVSKQDLAANAVGVLAAWGWWKLWQPKRRSAW